MTWLTDIEDKKQEQAEMIKKEREEITSLKVELEEVRKEAMHYYNEYKRVLYNRELQEDHLKELKENTRLHMVAACNIEEQTELMKKQVELDTQSTENLADIAHQLFHIAQFLGER